MVDIKVKLDAEEMDNFDDIIEKDISYADYPIANFSGFCFIFKEVNYDCI